MSHLLTPSLGKTLCDLVVLRLCAQEAIKTITQKHTHAHNGPKGHHKRQIEITLIQMMLLVLPKLKQEHKGSHHGQGPKGNQQASHYKKIYTKYGI